MLFVGIWFLAELESRSNHSPLLHVKYKLINCLIKPAPDSQWRIRTVRIPTVTLDEWSCSPEGIKHMNLGWQ